MDNLTPEQRRRNMSNVRSKNTLPELLIARELKSRKIYFSQHSSKIIGKPDFIFRRKKVLVFVDSEFWHGHPTKFKLPKSNQDYWTRKIARNVERDKQVNEALENEGWKVIRLWEQDIKKNEDKCIHQILDSLGLESR